MKRNFPKISFVIPTLNDAKRLRLLLESIKNQDYPKDKIEIIVIDDDSTDNNVEVAKEFTAKILMNGRKNEHKSLTMGFHIATGEFAYQIDQDVELRSKNFLKEMTKPLVENPDIAGSFTRYYPNSRLTWISRFLSYDPIMRDPIYEYFTPRIEDTYIEKKDDYIICDYSSKKITSFTMMMYRMKFLRKNPLWDNEFFYDHETVFAMIESGFTKFAYVPKAGLYHDHADNLVHLLKKRIRNLTKHYLITDSPYKYRWFDTSSFRGILKIAIWIVYANLIFPAAIRGLIRAIKFRDTVLLTEPLLALTITDVILYKFLTLSQGRAFLKRSFAWIFK